MAFYDVVWVMVGPVYERDVPSLPMADKEHPVPSGFWKIVITQAHGEGLKVAGFVMNQDTPGDAKLIDQLRTVRHIEMLTGLDFFRSQRRPRSLRIGWGERIMTFARISPLFAAVSSSVAAASSRREAA